MHSVGPRRADLSDAELVELARSGEHTSFDTLVERYQRAVYAAAFAVLSECEAALDVLQESMISAYRQISSLDDPSKFGPWICAIARNQALRHYRKQSLLRNRETSYPPVDSRMGPEMFENDISLRIRDAMTALTSGQAQVVTLFYMEGYSVDECGRLLGIPSGTVKRRLHDARQRLKKEMTDMVEKHLAEFSLPEDYKVVLNKPNEGSCTYPVLFFFKDRWVMIWQTAGCVWGDERYEQSHFTYWLAESRDGRAWSDPRQIEIPFAPEPDGRGADHFFLKGACVLGDSVYIQTQTHWGGVDIYSSDNLVDWALHPRVQPGNIGRSELFAGDTELFLVYPNWIASQPHWGDRVNLIRSSDGGYSWRWMSTPYWGQSGITDAAGAVIGGRVYVLWREHGYEEGAKLRIFINWSDDGGLTWARTSTKPVEIRPLVLTPPNGSLSLQLAAIGDVLVVAQEVFDGRKKSEVWLAFSRDGGETWSDKALYSTGSLVNPTIAFSSEGMLMMAFSGVSDDKSWPLVIHSRLDL